MSRIGVTGSIQAVIFDLDDILMDSEWLAFKIWGELVAQHGGTLSEADYAETIGISAEETATYIMQRTGVQFDAPRSIDWVWKRLEDQMRTGIEPMPGAKELVQKLARMGCPLAIASNGLSGYIEIGLRGLGLLSYFPVRCSIDQVPEGKPAPDVYLSAARQLGVDPSRCMAIDDSPAGVQSALAAGMRVIAVPTVPNPNGAFKGAWKVYPSLVEVRKDLENLLMR